MTTTSPSRPALRRGVTRPARQAGSARPQLANLTPLGQLRAGRLPRRLTQLFVGLGLYGLSMAMLVRGTLGLDPWDVFHFGVATHLPLSFGTVVIVTGVAVLLLWIPLRQMPGLGTVANAVVIGLATDAGLALIPAPEALAGRTGLLLGGVLLNGLAGAMYIGSQLGPGPRDGLMTGLVRRTGLSVRLVRTSLELTVVAVGWLLGGVVGIGTVLYALSIGPLVQALLPHFIVDLADEARVDPVLDPGPSAEAPAGAQTGTAVSSGELSTCRA